MHSDVVNGPSTGIFVFVVLAGAAMVVAGVLRAREERIEDTRRQWLQRWLTLGVWIAAVIVVPVFATTTHQPKLTAFVVFTVLLIMQQVRHDLRSR